MRNKIYMNNKIFYFAIDFNFKMIVLNYKTK